VTISVPEASRAACMVARSVYLPVPRMRRERKVRPPSCSGSTAEVARVVVVMRPILAGAGSPSPTRERRSEGVAAGARQQLRNLAGGERRREEEALAEAVAELAQQVELALLLDALGDG